MERIKEQLDRAIASRRKLRERILVTAMALLLIGLLQAYAFQLFVVPSRSMVPTLRPGDIVLVDRLTYAFGAPQRGDLIVFHFPQADDRGFLKRVIGLPGDTVAEREGRVWVNGAPVARPPGAARDPAPAQEHPPVRVPAGQYFVLGDNPATSLDSRVWGPVAASDMVGKVLGIVWSQGAHWWQVRWHRIGRELQ